MRKSTVQYSLRGYQEKTIQLIKKEVSLGKKHIASKLATGAGKGLIMSHMVNGIVGANKSVLTIMMGRSLVTQTDANYSKYHNIMSGLIMGGHHGHEGNSIICSISSFKNRVEKGLLDPKRFDYCIIDEMHCTTSATFEYLFKKLDSKCLTFGFTATPYAIGNKWLPFWDSFVEGAKYSELVDQGFLVPYKYYAPAKAQIDLRGLRTSKGDYDMTELFNRSTDTKIVGDVVDNYLRLGKNKPALLFATNVAHSKLMVSAFNKRDIPAKHVDADTPEEERQAIIKQLKTGEIKVLCNVNVLSTGIDIPEIEVLISVRPTKSLVLWVQQIGRAFRLSEGKSHAIIIDHSSNFSRHGFPDDDHLPQLEYMKVQRNADKDKKKKIATFKLCPDCMEVNPAGTAQCKCGYLFTDKDLEKKFIDGQLVEITRTNKRHEAIKNLHNRSEKLRLDKGFKRGWVYHRLLDRYPLNEVQEALSFKIPDYVVWSRREKNV